MSKHHIPALALALGASLACAQQAGPFEGGQAASSFQWPQADSGERLMRSTVAAEARQSGRQLDSRAGMQSDAVRAYSNAPLASVRSREEVRAEGRSSARERVTHAFEGGEASSP